MSENTNRIVTINPLEEDFKLKIFDSKHKMEIEEPVENCIFHKWTTKKFTNPENEKFMQSYDFGLIEMPNGEMKYFKPEQIVFKNI